MTSKWIRITHCQNIPLREGRAVKVGSCEIAFFNLGDRILAVENRCPHRGGPLADGITSGSSVVCPLHAWKVDLECGEVVKPADAGGCVRTFQTRVEDEIVFLNASNLEVLDTFASNPDVGICQAGAEPAEQSDCAAQ